MGGAPWCFLPPDHGYSMVGEPEDTGTGYRVTLTRTGSSSYYGDDSPSVFVDFIFDSDYRLHIKVAKKSCRPYATIMILIYAFLWIENLKFSYFSRN